VAFDPLSETLYTVVSGSQANEGGKLNNIISYPTLLLSEDAEEHMKSKKSMKGSLLPLAEKKKDI
jgi:hypothetical protein